MPQSPTSRPLPRVNDWLLKINDMDLTNKDRKQVVKAVLNGGGLINMVVRRRKSLGGRLVTPIHINLVGHKGLSYRYVGQLAASCLIAMPCGCCCFINVN